VTPTLFGIAMMAIMLEATSNQPSVPALAAGVDRASFRYARPLESSAPGLVVLPLDIDVVARSRNLDDVRIVNATSHQVPYIVERREQPLKINVAIPRRIETERGISRYHLRLPYATLPSGSRIVITTPARVFERTVRLVRSADERRGREESEIAHAQWRNHDPETAAAPLLFDTVLYGTAAIDLLVNEGDNAALPISSIEILVPSFALRFEHPGGALTLLYGNRSANAPRYDLTLLAPRILKEPAREIRMSRPPATADAESQRETKYFWIAVAAAAIVLLLLFARLIAPAMHEKREA
jgi:hypothetical protein